MYPLIAEQESPWLETTVNEIAGFAADHDKELAHAVRSGTFLAEIYREMGSRGWIGSVTSPDQGGSGLGVPGYCVIEEECTRHRLVSPQISVQGQLWLNDHGTPDQRERYLRPMATGELLFSESISEPRSGSSLKHLETRAVRRGGDWLINGHKIHVNLGAQADLTLVFADTAEGLTAFYVEMDQPGVECWQTEPVGLRLIPTAEVTFTDVLVSGAAVLGTPGEGLATFLSTFNISRLGNASMLIGTARRALTHGIDYAQQRMVGDALVASFQGIQWTVADAYDSVYAAALARDRAALLAAEGRSCALETSTAKVLAIQAGEQATNDVFALIGGHGLYLDEEFTQLIADVKVLRIAGGSIEVLRNHVARRILRSAGLEGLR